MIITLRQLEEMDACEPAGDLFKKVFGEKASLNAVVEELHKRNLIEYEAWLLAQDYELTNELIKVGANIHADNDFALRWAARNGRLRVVKLLLKKSANIHAYNDAALCLAARNGRLEIVKLLLESGADIHVNNNCVLSWAAEKYHLEIVNFLKKAMENS